jgi:molecular chaperone DnaK
VMARNGDVRVRVGRRHHAPADIAAYVLGALKAAAERLANGPVSDAVLAVPAAFNDLQRQAMLDGARIAGLLVKAVVTEPAAVAMACGLYPFPRGQDKHDKHDKKERKVLVYDLGGGSFNVAALALREDALEVVASGGDAFLGGEDFDQRIVTYVCEEFVKAGGGDLRRERLVLPRLAQAAERAKRELSTVASVDIRLPELLARMPAGIHLDRARLEKLTQDLVDRTVWPCEAVIRDAKWSPGDVEMVVMVGGQTRMPRIRAHIAEWLEREPLDLPSAEALVAVGAARQGLALAGAGTRRRTLHPVVEVTSLSLGIESAGGVLTRLTPKGTPLPASRAQVFSTSSDGQAHITVHLLQGEREMAADNDSIARIQVGPLRSAPRGVPQIEVEIVTDGGGLPRAHARDLATEEPVAVRLRPSGGLSELEITTLAASHAGGFSAAAPVDEVPAGEVAPAEPERERVDPIVSIVQGS